MKLKNFYIKNYPSDDLGGEINSKATFIGLLDRLHRRKNIYNYLGVRESIIRERLFQKLSDLVEEDYSHIYNLWTAGFKCS